MFMVHQSWFLLEVVYHDETMSKNPTFCHGPMIIEDNFVKASNFVNSQKKGGFVRSLARL